MTVLKPMLYPFDGIRVIEASAGTGKTWTIEALYLRLLLGHGRPALRPDHILVVTFTNAATDELRNRIRQRMHAAMLSFQGGDTEDDFLRGLRAEYAEAQWPECARTLELALQWMDEAAIHTIHAWCSQVLRRHPLAGRTLGDIEIQDSDELLLEVVRDYWRMHCLTLPGRDGARFAELFKQPDSLLKGVKLRLRSAQSSAESLTGHLARVRVPAWDALAAIKRTLRERHEDFATTIAAARAAGTIKPRKMAAARVADWLQQVDAWAQDEALSEADALEKASKQFTPAGLTEAWQADPPVHHPYVRALEGAAATCERLREDLVTQVHVHAAQWCAPRLEALKAQRGIAGSDDLVRRVADALKGPSGGQLATLLRERYPVAMVDEFQDTDATQWAIFRAVYEHAAGTSLTLIGDPKQSIYGFRGADLETYLRARDIARAIYPLATNYRSIAPLVTAVNRVFEHADRLPARAFVQEGAIPFLPMAAHRAAPDEGMDAVPPGLTFWLHREQCSGDVLRAHLSRACAQRIVELLQTVRPQNIAVLVRGWVEAEAIRWALGQRGVRSVYLSERDSVYRSPEAGAILRLLDACAHPQDDRRVRAAFALPLLKRPLAELARLEEDEVELERLMKRFLDYHALWRQHGVLALIYRVAHDFELLESGVSDRELTNTLHLADLLQNEAASLDGEHALLRTLKEHIDSGGAAAASEEHIVRLESDEDVVRVVTVHKSKGLEYPLVFLPFATAPSRETTGDEDTTPEAQRLLYVALTRARHACWVGVAPTTYRNHNATHRSLLGYTLNGGEPIEPDALPALLDALCGDEATITLTDPPVPDGSRHREQRGPHQAKPALRYRAASREAWWIGSYSALQLGPQRFQPVESALEQAIGDSEPEAPATSVDPSIHHMPRGAHTGNFLHGLLEWAAARGFAAAAADDAARLAEITRRCRHRFDAQAWAPVLDRWMKALLVTPLAVADARFALADLTLARSELEFFFGARRVDAQRVDDLVSAAILPGQGRPGVEPGMLNGMLKGYIDLVFEQGGRYFVADFKSNALGDDDAAYTQANMAAQILKKRYDLQFTLYTLALHRLLKLRLGDGYDYDRHIGGAVYLFLRGIHEPTYHGVYALQPPRALIESLDALFDGKEVRDVA